MNAYGKIEPGPNFSVLERVPQYKIQWPTHNGKQIAIIDLETTGLNYKTDKITEIGIIAVQLTYDTDPECEVLATYQSFNDPCQDIISQITRLTGITNDMVKGERINWETVLGILNTSDIVVCHNATFDRKFLEQTPIGDNFKNTLFACTKNDIDWAAREYGANKLDYLNWKLGYFYDAHRAINDCWATLNLLMQEPDAYRELLSNCQDMHEVYALNAPYAVKDILKNSGFFWSNGESKPYKAWVKLAKTDEHRDDIIEFLQDNKLASPKVITIAAKRKYSSAGE